MEFIHAVPKREKFQSPVSVPTGLNHSLQSKLLGQDMHKWRRLLPRSESTVVSQPDDRHSAGDTGCDIVSCLLQRRPLLIRLLLRLGVILPASYNCAGESLYAQAASHDNREMMRYILRKLKLKDLLNPIWLHGKNIGPSYIQVATSHPELFQAVLDEWLLRWPSEVPSLLTEESLYSIARFATPEIASSLQLRGVYLDGAKGPEGQSVWHAVVEFHQYPEEMLRWLRKHSLSSCDSPSSNGNTPLMMAIQLGRLEAAMWLSKRSDLEPPSCLSHTAPELVTKCQSDECVDTSSLLTEANLYSIARFATPEIASRLQCRGVFLDRAKGPEGQSVWHAVVEYQQRPKRMLQWLLDHSALSCDTASCNGNTPLMLAIQLGRLEAAMWLSEWSDLGVPNCFNLLTAPELAAKCQTDESVAILRVIMKNITLKEQHGRDLTRKVIHAVGNSRKDRIRRLEMWKVYHKECATGRGHQRTEHYLRRLDVANRHAFEKVQILCIAIGNFDELIQGLAELGILERPGIDVSIP